MAAFSTSTLFCRGYLARLERPLRHGLAFASDETRDATRVYRRQDARGPAGGGGTIPTRSPTLAGRVWDACAASGVLP